MIGNDNRVLHLRAAELLKQSRFTVAFTGAGISTASGIPDFRSPNSGLWEGVDPFAVASIFGFKQNPKAFYDWIQPLAQLAVSAKPNAAHDVLAELEALGYLQTVITQNIDMLHTRAGNTTVYELHGHLREATCTQCFEVFPAAPIIEKFLGDSQIPHCPTCNGVLKPNVILFGEQLPHRELQAAQDAARKADAMIIIGSSLEVAPASDIPILAKRNGAKLIIINLEPTSADRMADVVIHEDAGAALTAIIQHMRADS